MPAELDPDAQAILDVIAAAGQPHIATLSVDEARAFSRAALTTKGMPLALHSVDDLAVPTPDGPRPMRVYRPAAGRLAVALFLHGGGWTINDLDTHDDLCRRLARRARCAVAALDYRKAPEHRHPAALQDAYAAYHWVLDNAASLDVDPARRALVGESSGAHIAANLALLLRDHGAPPPTYQVLAYPATDRFDSWPSYTERADGYILDRKLMRWYFGHFLPQSPDERYLYPLAREDLAGLPATLMLTAEFDPLRDEGVAFAARLKQAGVPVEHVHAADQMHGFLLFGRVIPNAAALVERTGDALGRALS